MKWIFILSLLSINSHAGALTTFPESQVFYKYSDWSINHRSVCQDQPLGSLEFRTCRVVAKKLFKARCLEFSEMSDNATFQYRDENNLLENKKMYCRSARLFRP